MARRFRSGVVKKTAVAHAPPKQNNAMRKSILALCLAAPFALCGQSQTSGNTQTQPAAGALPSGNAPGGGPGASGMMPAQSRAGQVAPPQHVPPQGFLTTPPGGVPLTPSNNATATPLNTSEAALENQRIYNNLFGRNADPQSVQTLLLELQTQMERTIPVLYSVVNGWAAPAPGSALYNATVPGVQNMRGTTARTGNAVARSTVPGQNPNIPNSAAFLATIGTNTYRMDRETLELISRLTADLQRTVPVVRALNGNAGLSPNGVAVAGPGLPLARRLSPLAAPSPAVQSPNTPIAPTAPPLIPTGR